MQGQCHHWSMTAQRASTASDNGQRIDSRSMTTANIMSSICRCTDAPTATHRGMFDAMNTLTPQTVKYKYNCIHIWAPWVLLTEHNIHIFGQIILPHVCRLSSHMCADYPTTCVQIILPTVTHELFKYLQPAPPHLSRTIVKCVENSEICVCD